MITDRLDVDHGENLDLLYRVISIEAKHDGHDVEFGNKLDKFTSGMRRSISDKILAIKTIGKFNYPTKDMGRFLKVNPYDTIMNLTIFKPSGLNVSYMEALNTIERHHESAISVEKRLLDPFIKWSAEMLTDPSKLSELSSLQSLNMIEVETINDDLDKLFDLTSKTDMGEYSDLIKRNSEWRDVARSIRILINRQNRLKPSRLIGKVDKASEAVNKIISYCRTNPDIHVCSEYSRGQMADMVFAMGKEVSLVSRMYHLIRAMVTAVEDSAEKLTNL